MEIDKLSKKAKHCMSTCNCTKCDYSDEKTILSCRKLLQDCYEKLAEYEDLEEQGLLIRLPCKVGDTVWELCKCDDCTYRIFPMKVADVIPYGSVREIKGKEPATWNIYAISDYTDMYKSFYDIGKTVFLTKEEAEEALMKTKEREAVEIIEQAADDYNNGWIPCSERMPEEGKEVLCTDGKYVYLVEYDENLDASFGDIGGIMAWQPVPEPYQPKG